MFIKILYTSNKYPPNTHAFGSDGKNIGDIKTMKILFKQNEAVLRACMSKTCLSFKRLNLI